VLHNGFGLESRFGTCLWLDFRLDLDRASLRTLTTHHQHPVSTLYRDTIPSGSLHLRWLSSTIPLLKVLRVLLRHLSLCGGILCSRLYLNTPNHGVIVYKSARLDIGNSGYCWRWMGPWSSQHANLSWPSPSGADHCNSCSIRRNQWTRTILELLKGDVPTRVVLKLWISSSFPKRIKFAMCKEWTPFALSWCQWTSGSGSHRSAKPNMGSINSIPFWGSLPIRAIDLVHHTEKWVCRDQH
jgi:hypothetical protein